MGTDEKKIIVNGAALAKTFDEALIVILDLETEAMSLIERFGTESKLVRAKCEQLRKLKALHAQALDYINFLRDYAHKLTINYKVMELFAMKHDTGLPWEKVARLLGWNTEQFKKLDDIDPLFRKIMQDIIDLEKIKVKDDKAQD